MISPASLKATQSSVYVPCPYPYCALEIQLFIDVTVSFHRKESDRLRGQIRCDALANSQPIWDHVLMHHGPSTDD